MKHTEDFKREAVRIALSSGLSRARGLRETWALANLRWRNGEWIIVRTSRDLDSRLIWPARMNASAWRTEFCGRRGKF